jgi:hypothetical protein
MPGLIVSVAVAPGQEVKLGQELCVLEAMKMENVLRAERDGAIAEVNVAPPRHGRGRPDPADLRVTPAPAKRPRSSSRGLGGRFIRGLASRPRDGDDARG